MNNWNEIINTNDLNNFSKGIYSMDNHYPVYPSEKNVLRALELLNPSEVKVVILGQDPYHGKNQANGLAFSVNKNEKIPPSLKNIYKELEEDLNIWMPNHGDLTRWAKQGVLLLNSVLTVYEDQPSSHYLFGWEKYTNQIVKGLSDKYQNLVFVLWGRKAQLKTSLIDQSKHLVIEAAHPSPLSAHNGFFGSKPFSKINTYLKEHGQHPIDWRLS